jgi:hypothetical protein
MFLMTRCGGGGEIVNYFSKVVVTYTRYEKIVLSFFGSQTGQKNDKQ